MAYAGRIAILLTCLDFGVREPDFYGAIPFLLLKETYMVDMVYYVDEEVIQVLSEQFKGSGKPMLYHKESILVIWSK
ncbi:hypothetical protein YC2023_040686 [Brassica napus]